MPGEKLRVLDLFSGIGGFSLGLERTGGFRTVAFCEIDPYCRRVLAKHWPSIKCFEDVRTITATDVGAADVICGGFPCQPYSVAGDRMADKDDRALWPEYCRLIEELRPSWVLGENVIGLVELGLDSMLDDLEGLGYATRTFDIPACALGARHERRRVWIVANANSDRRQDESTASDRLHQESFLWERVGTTFKPFRFEADGVIFRDGDGIPEHMDRIRALGNAVVPQIPEIIGRAILEAEKDLTRQADSA